MKGCLGALLGYFLLGFVASALAAAFGLPKDSILSILVVTYIGYSIFRFVKQPLLGILLQLIPASGLAGYAHQWGLPNELGGLLAFLYIAFCIFWFFIRPRNTDLSKQEQTQK